MKKIDIVKLLLVYIIILAIFSFVKQDSIFGDILGIGFMMIIFFFSLKQFLTDRIINKSMLILLMVISALALITGIVNDHLLINPRMLRFFYSIFCVFVLLFLNNKYSCNEKSLWYFCLGITIFCLITCLYNVIINLALFPKLLSLTSSYDVIFKSFFNNRNTFAYLLMSGIVCNSVLLILNKNDKYKKYLIGSIIFLFINLFLTFSRASIFSSGLIIFIFSLMMFSRKTNLKLVGIFFGILVVLFIIPFSRNFILDNIIRLESGVTHRDELFVYGIDYFKSHNYFIGNGFSTPFNDLAQYFSYKGFHNVFLTVLITEGFIGLIIYLVLTVYSIVNSYKLRKYNKSLGSLFLAFNISYIFYSFFESLSLFSTAFYVFLTSVLLVVIPLYLLNYYKKIEYSKINDVKKNKDGDLISIIIPVYNSSKYIDKCMESVLKQDYKNIEIILVDNGSSDNSLNICLEYQKNNTNIKVIHLDRKGVSLARNEGLRVSGGKYICFIDSDDFVEKDFISSLYNNIIYYNADLSIVNYSFVENNDVHSLISYTEPLFELYNNKDMYNKLFSKKVRGFVWNKMYKKELLNDIEFNESISYREDLLFNIQYLSKVNKAIFFNKPLYNYVQNDNSVLHEKKFNENMLSHFEVLDLCKELYKKNGMDFDEFFTYDKFKAAANLKGRLHKETSDVYKNKVDKVLDSSFNELSIMDNLSFKKKFEIYLTYKFTYPVFVLKKVIIFCMRFIYE